MAHVPANIYFKDTESRFLRVNQNMAERMEISHPSDLVGKTDHDIFGPGHADQAKADEEKIIRTGTPITGLVEWELLPGGKEGWVLTNKMPFRDKSGKIIGTFGMSSDVNELIETQHQLERERNMLRSLIDSFPDQIFVRDRDRRFTVVNKAMADWVGAGSAEKMLGKLPEDFYQVEVAQRSLEEDTQVLESGEPVMNRELRATSPITGESRVLVTTKVPLLDAEGTRWGVVGMIRDVTEQRIAREKLVQSERRMQDVMDNSPAVISLKDVNGTYLMVNLGFETLFGMTRRDVLGRTDHDFIADKRAADRFRQHDLMVIERNESLQVDDELMVDGELRTYVAVRFPIRDLQGKVIAVGGISTDITERREAEEALSTLNSDLYEANESLKATQEQLIHAEKMESVGRLAAGVAHEVKNPLAMIGMGLELLARRMPADDAKARETIDRMKRGIDRAKKIVKGLVDFSSARQLLLEKCDVNEVVSDAIALTDYQLRKGRVTLHTDLPPDLPPVDLDATKMEQVLVNLIINAMHAMPSGGELTVRTSHRVVSDIRRDEGLRTSGHLREGDSVVKIEIADNGDRNFRGKPEQALRSVFHHQGHRHRNRPRPGGVAQDRRSPPGPAHLGKPPGRRRARHHLAEVASAPPRRFHISILARGTALHLNSTTMNERPRILIIDDENDFSSVLKENLEEVGEYTVMECNNSRDALQTIREFQPNLCLIDVVMPGLDGGDIVAQLRADKTLRRIPVVMLTALVEENPNTPDGETVTGGLPFLSKTSPLEQLLLCIEKHLAGTSLR